MATQKEQIIAAVAAEREEYLAKIEEVLSTKPGWSDSDVTEVIDAIKGIVPKAAIPSDGTHNITMSATSDGAEYMKISLVNNRVRAERAALLADVKDGVKAAGTAQAAGGSSFGSVFNYSDNGTADSFTFNNGNQKNAGDIAFLEAFLAEAKAALAAGSPPPP